jgi:hypothetical protein
MKKIKVHYQVNDYVYETIIHTDTSGAAIAWVKSVFPHAFNVHVVSIEE